MSTPKTPSPPAAGPRLDAPDAQAVDTLADDRPGEPPLRPPSNRATATPRRRWRVWLLVVLVALLVVGGVLAGAVGWAASTASGTAWLLARLPMVTVTEPQGPLLGDFRARQLSLSLGGTDRVVIDRLQWDGLRVRPTLAPRLWAQLSASRLAADRVAIEVAPKPPSGEPFAWPKHLRLPVSLDVPSVRIGELALPSAPGQHALTLSDLQAHAQLGARGGAHHRLDDLSLRLEPMQVQGHVAIDADGPMALDVDLRATQSPGTAGDAATAQLPDWVKRLRADWQAGLKARGPLARFEAEAQIRAQGQALDAKGVIAAAEPWPVPQLDATTRDLDVSAFSSTMPATRISGDVRIAPASGQGASAPVAAQIRLTNSEPGRWDERRLPVRQLSLEADGSANASKRFDLRALSVAFAGTSRPAGTMTANGFWDRGDFELKARLDKLQPGLADPRLPAMTLSGPVTLSGRRGDEGSTLPRDFQALADIAGRLDSPARAVQLRLDARGNRERIELKELRASVDQARALASGHAERIGGASPAWKVEGKASLVEFDPQPWLPSLAGSSWQRGTHRLNADADWAVTVPEPAAGGSAPADAMELLAQLRGQANAQIKDSLLAGVRLDAGLGLTHTGNQPLQITAQLDAAGNRANVEGQLSPSAQGSNDRWNATVRADEIGRLAPLLALVPGLEASGVLQGLSGRLDAEARVDGRWPALATQGRIDLPALRGGPLRVTDAKTDWQFGTVGDAPWDIRADIEGARWGAQQLDLTRFSLRGNAGAHTLDFSTDARAAPPAWVDALQGTSGRIDIGDTHTRARVSARGAVSGGPFAGTTRAGAAPPPLSWQGVLQAIELRSGSEDAKPWLSTRDVAIDWRGGEQGRIRVGRGRAQVLEAAMRWDRIDWQAGGGLRTQQLDVQAELEPLNVAPLLQRLQPEFGWGGDLKVNGRIVVRQTDAFSADIVIERQSGDLQVTDDAGTQPLGLTDLRLGLNAQNGVWSFTQGLAGKQLGVAAGAVVVRTSPQSAWPEATAPMEGVLEVQVANLGTWGPWVPPGWRLGGQLGVTASLGGRFGAPEYTGDIRGKDISMRNLLQGVDVTEGTIGVTLEGETARIRTFTAKAGPGQISLSGDATFGSNPRAQLALVADRFQVLGRVDRRVVASGDARLLLERESLRLDGKLRVDEGLFDFSRGDAPSLAEDVTVTGRSSDPAVAGAETSPVPARQRDVHVDLLVNLGEKLRLKGYGIDTGLRGEVRLTTPNGRLAINGSVRTEGGNYAAYGQKLTIDRGVITFIGPPEDPRLDIEAVRPDIDERVGVQIGGTAQNPRVRLYSQNDMSDTDRLSWLLLGRANDGLGSNDTALLQRAALALLSGEGEGVTDQFTKAIGIDEISLRQSDGEVRETIVTVGKQLSRRWYVGYERSLEATTGNWQLIYRIAQRFTLRAQSGFDNSLDLIWTWRWE